jgi:Carboxylesterase family
MSTLTRLVSLLLLAYSATATPAKPPPDEGISNSASSLTLLFQNNLNASDDHNHVGAILLDPRPASFAEQGCQALGESLLTQTTIQNYTSDFSEALAYLEFAYGIGPAFQIDSGLVVLSQNRLSFAASGSQHRPLPVLCSQSSNASQPPNSTAATSNEITVKAAGNEYVGFRNQKSFRFLGIRYADPPERFVYSHLYSNTGETAHATAYGSQCTQPGVGGEDCLFLNIQTPYIPKAGSIKNLRPVLFWIHGGGFTGGTGADPQTDGGNLASREDIVVVTFNYRLRHSGS